MIYYPKRNYIRALGYRQADGGWHVSSGVQVPCSSISTWSFDTRLAIMVYAKYSSFPGHPLAQRPHIAGPLGLEGLKYQGFGTERPPFGGALDVEGFGYFGAIRLYALSDIVSGWHCTGSKPWCSTAKSRRT